MQRIKRGFVTIGDRQVHYRIAGSGPPVVLIHQSPISSKSLEMQTAAYGDRFTAIAIDIPGLGLSDPLPCDVPTAEDLAIGLAETLDALGINRTALFGSHTGATICVEFARRYPQRTVQVLIDGFPVYTPSEQARRLATYFGTFDPRWDAGHLLWVWARFREQYLFYPWNAPGRGTRADCDVPPTEFLHSGVVDLLTAGNGYIRPYTAAYTYDAAQRVRELTVPTYFLVYRDDSLAQAHALLEGLPSCCEVVPMPDDRTVGIEKEIELLCAARDPGNPVSLPETTSRQHGITRRYLNVEDTQLLVHEAGQAAGRPILVLPPAPGSATGLLDRLSLLAAHRPVMALDLPSCGHSDRDPDGEASLDALTDRVEQASKQLGADVDLYGVNGGALVALELGRRGATGRIAAEGVPYLPGEGAAIAARYAPPIVLEPDGTHWIKLWYAVRSEQLFWPWYDQRETAIRPIGPLLDPAVLTDKVLSYMRQPESYSPLYKTILTHEGDRIAASVTEKVTLFAGEHDVFSTATSKLAAATNRSVVALMPSEIDNAAALCVALDR